MEVTLTTLAVLFFIGLVIDTKERRERKKLRKQRTAVRRSRA